MSGIADSSVTIQTSAKYSTFYPVLVRGGGGDCAFSSTPGRAFGHFGARPLCSVPVRTRAISLTLWSYFWAMQ